MQSWNLVMQREKEHRNNVAALRALRVKGKARGLFTIEVERGEAMDKALQAWRAWLQRLRLKREAAEELLSATKRRELEIEELRGRFEEERKIAEMRRQAELRELW